MLTIRKKLAPTWFDLHSGDAAPGFLLAPLSNPGRLDARNEVATAANGHLSITGRGAVALARDCIRDWRNVVDETGAPIEFDPKLIPELPAEALRALAGEILERASLSESERKNSSSPST